MSMRFKWKKQIVIALGFFILVWVGDAVIDALFFDELSLSHGLATQDPRELYMRTICSVLLALLFLVVTTLGETRRRAENSLRQSDELSRIFFESANDAICVIETDELAITGANGIFLRTHGITEKEALGQSFADLISRQGLPEEILGLVAQCVVSGVPANREISYLAAGEKVYQEVSCYPIGDTQRGIERVLHVTRDISARRRSEALLKESEQRYRAIFENTGTAMAITLPDGILHVVNKGFEAITGYSREELEGRMRWTDFVCDESKEEMLEKRSTRWGDSGVRQECFSLRMKNRLGEDKPMVGNWAAIGDTRETVVSLLDITAQKRVEDALRQSRATLAVAQRIASLGNWDWDVVTDSLTWSEEVFRIFGIDSASPPTYEEFLRAVHPDDRERVIKAINDALFNKKPYHMDHRIVLPGGAVRTLSSRGEVSFDAEGRPLRMVGTNQDVTWRNEAEQALRSSEEKFSKAFHASPDSIVITRAQDGTYIDVNEAFQEMTGYTRAEVTGHSSLELKLWADPEARMVMLRLLNQYGHVRNLDVRFRVKSGETREILWSADVIEYRGEACLIAISRDVTDQRQLEKELLESDAKLYMKHEELKNLFHQMEGIRREWEETMDCISDMFILADQWGRIRRFNRAVETFTGKAHRDIVGRECLQFLEAHGLKGHLQAPGAEIFHEQSGKWLVLKRYAFPTPEVDGSTREVVIINDTTGTGRRDLDTPQRLAQQPGDLIKKVSHIKCLR
ncbi:MAG TPA: PAS domain S-box protein [Geomonas sp.]